MIGADDVRQAGGLIELFGDAHEERNPAQILDERLPAGEVVHRIHAGDDEHGHFAAGQLASQRFEAGVAAATLARRPVEIDCRSVRAEKVVDEVADDLRADVLTAGHDERATARGPHARCKVVEPWIVDTNRLERPRGGLTSKLREPHRQLRGQPPNLVWVDTQSQVGLRAGQRQTRLDLYVAPLRHDVGGDATRGGVGACVLDR